MLTRFVRTQLIIFTIASIVGVAVMIFSYLQVPTLLGVGKINVKLQLPATGGLYRFSNVTYNGVQIGKVTDIKLTPDGAEATLILDRSPKVPANLKAEVKSVSAVGEQFVDLRPQTDSAPYLENGSVIPAGVTSIPQAVGPMLDKASKLVDSIPKDRISDLLGESFKAFNGAGYDLQSLLDSASKITGDANAISDQTRTLIDDSVPLLDSQVQTTDAIRQWSRSLAGITTTLDNRTADFRNLLQQAPGTAQEVSRLLNDLKPTLPVLLANLTTVGQMLVTYNASVEQLLVLLPPYIAAQQAYGLATANASGLPLGEFALESSDPPPCTVGFLPPSQWRSPQDQTDIDTPDGLYCKLPQDSPLDVRGARNFPCIKQPGKRAPTVEICDSDKPFEPIAIRQHATGAYPFDPSQVGQGVPLDDRINTGSDGLFGPMEGTPRPPAAVLPPAAPDVAPVAPAPGPAAVAPAVGDPGAPIVAPSANRGGAPKVAFAPYDPNTGSYLGPDGQVVRQTNLVAGARAQTWKDMLPT